MQLNTFSGTASIKSSGPARWLRLSLQVIIKFRGEFHTLENTIKFLGEFWAVMGGGQSIDRAAPIFPKHCSAHLKYRICAPTNSIFKIPAMTCKLHRSYIQNCSGIIVLHLYIVTEHRRKLE